MSGTSTVLGHVFNNMNNKIHKRFDPYNQYNQIEKKKANIFNNNLRLAMNSFGGKTSAGLSRSGNIKDFYTISVKKSDEHNARLLLSKIEG